MGTMRYVGWGALAGAAGSTALNATTYADMAARGRSTSSTPEDTVEALAGRAGLAIPGDGDTRPNRLSGLGALSGLATGVGIGVVFGLLRRVGVRPPVGVGSVLIGAAAMAATDGSMAALGVTDPREWDTASWVSDAVPHLAYGAVTAAALAALDRR